MVLLVEIRLVYRAYHLRGLRPPFSFLGCVVKRIIDFGLFLVLGLVGGALAAMPAQAYDGYYWAGYNAGAAGSPEASCQKFVTYSSNINASYGTYPLAEGVHGYNADQYVCYLYQSSQYDQWCTGMFITESRCIGDKEKGIGGTYTIIQKKSCPENPTGSLVEFCGAEPTNCPVAGTPKRIATPVNGTINNGIFVEDVPEGGMVIEIGGGLSADGCGYAIPIPDGNGVGGDVNPDTKVKCSPNGQCFRFSTYVATGQAREPGEGEATSVVIGDPESFVKEEDTNTDTRESRTSTTQTDPVTENLDGKQITSQTVTTIETRGDGAVVKTQDDITTVTQSDGITRTDTVTTTTTTNTDGSKTVETTNNISYTQAPQTIYNIDNSTGRVTVTATGGGTTSQQTRTTEDYNPQGQKVSESKEEGPVTGDDSAKEQQEEETCKTNPLLDKCIGEFKETAKGEFGDIAGKVLDAKEEYMDVFEDIKEQATAKLNFNLSGGGTTSDYMVSFRGTEGNIGITRWFALFDQYDLAALVMAIAALIAVLVILRA